jgi:hypothetical protein
MEQHVLKIQLTTQTIILTVVLPKLSTKRLSYKMDFCG